jgi:hypothetical protein
VYILTHTVNYSQPYTGGYAYYPTIHLHIFETWTAAQQSLVSSILRFGASIALN